MKKLSMKARARLGTVLAAFLLLINFGYYKSSKEAAFFGGIWFLIVSLCHYIELPTASGPLDDRLAFFMKKGLKRSYQKRDNLIGYFRLVGLLARGGLLLGFIFLVIGMVLFYWK